jgi:hypothetical protein
VKYRAGKTKRIFLGRKDRLDCIIVIAPPSVCVITVTASVNKSQVQNGDRRVDD